MEKTQADKFNKLPEGLAETTYKSWTDKWGDLVRLVEVPINKEETDLVTLVIRSPENDRNVCGAIENQIDRNLNQARITAINNCVLFGKDLVLDNNFAFRAASSYIFEQIPNGRAYVKN